MGYGERKSERVHFEHRYPMNLLGVDGTWRRSCVMLDVSASGAKLEVEGSLDVLRAQEFFLVLSSTGLAFRRCQLIRIDGCEVGVHLVPTDRKKKRTPSRSQ